ncbi:hypothetical protein CAPN001_24610 [Capnocytophaga stomatis]|uniref:Uncharacterized protein n=1 Tax=Capnocytophaga stomatis TaxID=1848904 RepID=A0A250FYS4_9FLAO|nr:hypothetical protein [Capnocytophaga stomatis]ATA90319.1 hypothetical protein CGC58_11605 [Capnocytophaga stomatis]GIJ97892.1 hypothetical protein CAPN001_24610 [Capnocytophaga stomatis]GIM50591.1 hypothetical protein CAPN003_20430 [Capnocytophaga stomatis]
MKKYILTIVTLFLIGCSAGKHVQLIQEGNENVEIVFYGYKNIQNASIYLRKKINLKNQYIRFADVRINYFIEREKVSDIYASPMDYGDDGNLYIIGSGKGEEFYKINISPFRERRVIYEINMYMRNFKFEGIYRGLEQYIPLGKHPLEKNELTGETYENKRVLSYQEPFSEFKRKNPELLEFLTKGDSIELEVISPVKQKYKFKAEW